MTMHGRQWRDEMERELEARGLKIEKRKCVQCFRGIGGKTGSNLIVTFPAGIVGHTGVLESAEVEMALPMLLSRQTLTSSGAHLHLPETLVDFDVLGAKPAPLIPTSKDHLAISLLDYGPDLSEFTKMQDDTVDAPGSEVYSVHVEALDPATTGMVANAERVEDGPKAIEMFETAGDTLKRRSSNRRAKKIRDMHTSLDINDAGIRDQMSFEPPIKARLYCGRSLLKQIVCGQLGLTFMATMMFGYYCGEPLDIELGWDASTSAGRRYLGSQCLEEDPYFTVVTFPCGPSGNWSRINPAKGGQARHTVEQASEIHRAVLKAANRASVDRVQRNRHVLVEQPRGTEAFGQPEMRETKGLIDKGILMEATPDGCALGYHDAESGLPHIKPMLFYTTSVALWSVLEGRKCSGNHTHEPLEGSNSRGRRTKQAAEWPTELDNLVLMDITLQIDLDACADAFPGEVEAESEPKRKRTRSKRQLTSRAEAPPENVEEIVEDEPMGDSVEARPLDPEGERGREAEGMNPTLSPEEGERRSRWLKVPPDIRRDIRRMHVNVGHPANVALARCLRRAGAKPEVIRARWDFSCDACGEALKLKHVRPVRMLGRCLFNFHMLLDVFHEYDCAGLPYAFLSVICDGTKISRSVVHGSTENARSRSCKRCKDNVRNDMDVVGWISAVRIRR